MEGAESCGRRRPRAPKASIGCLGVSKYFSQDHWGLFCASKELGAIAAEEAIH